MPPKFVLHVLVAKVFEVWGQNPVQQQNAPIQGPDTRDVQRRHNAARGPQAAPAQKVSARLPLFPSRISVTRTQAEEGTRPSSGLVRSHMRTFLKHARERRGGRARAGPPSKGAWLSWRAGGATTQEPSPEPRGPPPRVWPGPLVTLSCTPLSFPLILPLSLKAVVKTGLLQEAFQALNSSYLRCLTVFLPSGESLPPKAQPPTYLALSCAPNLSPEGGDSFL